MESDTAEDGEEHRAHRKWGSIRPVNAPAVVLTPDHPLIQKFQSTYKKCLEKEIARLDEEILEQREGLKQRKQHYTRMMSEDVYNLEQAVSRQRKSIVEYEEALKRAGSNRIECEEAVRERRTSYKDQLNKLNEEKKKDSELRTELEALSLLCKQYESWQRDTESELAVNQRISEKLTAEKREIAQQKKKMDMIVYNLTTEVWKLESEIELIEDQIQIKTKEFDEIKNRTADSATDLETLAIEQKHLIQLWNSVIVSIQRKDKMHADIVNEHDNVQNELRTSVMTVESIKKEIEKAMHEHEAITSRKDKIAYELAECTKIDERQEERNLNLEKAILETMTALELTENDLHKEQTENVRNKNDVKRLTRIHEKLINEKINLENDTLDKLKEQLSCDKATRDLADNIKQLKETSRRAEIDLIKNENQNAKIKLKTERQKIVNDQRYREHEEEKCLHREKQSEVKEMENKLKERLFDLDKKQTSLDLINKKIGAYLEKTGGKLISPVEMKIEETEKQIDQHTARIKQLQQDWLRMQGFIVQSMRQYQKNVDEVNLTSEQIQIMESKVMRLENSINTLKSEDNKMQKVLANLQTRIDQFSKQMSESKDYDDELEKKFNDLTVEHEIKLKNLETSVMALEEEIADLEEHKIQLAVDLFRCKKEVLNWEKMGISAMETKQKVDEEKNVNGEIGRMKMEIHRMRVRQSQLANTAARLSTDLEQAVWRRESAMGRARACSQSVAPRHTLLSKIKEKKLDLRRLNQEIEMNKSLIEKYEKENNAIEADLNEKHVIMLGMENELEDLKRQIEECQLSKQKNLEKIIRNQRYGQSYSAILSGQTRIYSMKSEPSVISEYNKQKEMNDKMVMLVQKLLEELPDHNFALMRILNTLNIDN